MRSMRQELKHCKRTSHRKFFITVVSTIFLTILILNSKYIVLSVGMIFLYIILNVFYYRQIKDSRKDQLTGLFVKACFIDRLEKIKTNEKGYIIYVDFKNLKLTNDQYGHYHGDRLLALFGNLVQKELKNVEAYRAGGDEFILLYLGNDIEQILKKIEEFKLCSIKISERKEVFLNFNVGYAKFSGPASVGKALDSAEHLMYVDKGRVNVI